jgi:protein-tyrosine phosphatase
MSRSDLRQHDHAGDAYRIVFVCSGNICRSPTAEVILRALVADAGLADRVEVCSAGIGDWHVGERADPRSAAALTRRGFDASQHRARQFEPDWFDDHDLVVALDRSHMRSLQAMAAGSSREQVRLLLSFDPESPVVDVPDPYYGGRQGFDDVLDMIERACRALLGEIRRELAA